MWIRGSRNDFNVVPHRCKLARHVTGVDALAAGVGVTAVGQERDA